MNSRRALISISRHCAVAVLATAIGLPVYAQQAQTGNDSQTTPHSVAQPSPEAQPSMNPPREGFWGRVNPFARKKWVQKRLDPINDRLSELDEVNARNAQAIKDVDERAQAGIKQAQSSADAANQNAQQASSAAGQANTAANDAAQRADSLDSLVKGLDNYKQLSDVQVNFGFDKSVLTADDKQQLDTFAAQLGSAKSYILEVTGGTDSVGNADYNYELSNRRADAVVQYMVTKYNIPAHRFYLIGIGKDQAVADNKTREGRAKNRRVELQLLSNMSAENTPPTQGSTQPAPATNAAPTNGTSNPADSVN